ncbi:MAG: DPP IV N-terminal domain-containing protein [Bacteroidales bacterium]|nr:DPP IV N-terminal domain-containing protein [Bacteroidales bacterium]
MKKALTFLSAAILAGGALFAQPRVIGVHPAHDGKLLTMEEAVAGRSVYPENRYYSWVNDNEYRFFDGKRWDSARLDEKLELPAETGWTAFSQGNSLYVTDYRDTLAVAISNDREIVYGQSVSRNEFGIDGGIFWAPDRTKLAFYRKDESRVTDFPLLDIRTRTGELRQLKYPMNGMDSERVDLGIYDLAKGSTIYLNVNEFTPERFLTNISWSPDGKSIYVQVLDRTQHHMKLNRYSAVTGEFVRTLLTEDNDAWVEPLDPVHFLKGRNDLMIYRTDNRDGFRNLYLLDTLGTIRRLTAVDADVEYVGNDGLNVYYTSAEISPVENHLYRISLQVPSVKTKKPSSLALQKTKIGRPVALTPERGWHTIAMNPSCTWFFDRYANLDTPGVSLLRSADGKTTRPLSEAADPLRDFASCAVELGTVPSADGAFENYYRLYYPKDFDPAKKYPVIVYVYGGPHSQMVQDTWLGNIRMWEMYMAQRGYVVYVQDNRGTSNRGAAFEKAINRQCGQAEMADQVAGLRFLMDKPWVDRERIGVHGWSYGGFMTISLITNYPDIFKVGVAGGPVIDWKWYEIMYGERYMDTEATNPEGFAKTSLINKAKDLKGKLLICQGAVDNTVVWEHSLSFVEECIRHNVQVDYFPYPTDEHNVMGRRRIHLMDKVTMYFEDYL